MHRCTVKNLICVGHLYTLTLSIIIYYMYMYRYTDKRGVKHYFGEKCILGGIKYTIFYIKV